MRPFGRCVFLVAAGIFLAAPSIGLAQQPARVHRLAVLSPIRSGTELLEIHLAALAKHGYVEGRNLEVFRVYGDGKKEGLPALASEIVRWKPDIIVAITTPATRAAKAATQTIPIVTVLARDLVEEGIVTSLARPAGNVTGLTQDVGTATSGKQFDFLKEAFPQVSRIAVLWDARAGCPASCKTAQKLRNGRRRASPRVARM